MSMFDSKLQRHVYEWADVWGTPQRKFKDRVRIESASEEMIIKLRGDNRTGEFCRIPQRDWEEGVRKASLSARLGTAEAIKFFLYHWMEERNMLPNLFTQLEELNHA